MSDKLKYFIEAWEMNGVGETVATVQDSPGTVVTITLDELRDLAAASAQAAEPIWCESCGDGITAHDPGICGTCFATKYRDTLASDSDVRRKALTDEQVVALKHLIARGSTFPDHNGASGSVSRVDYAHLATAAKVLSALLREAGSR
jgi:hypothetical protein